VEGSRDLLLDGRTLSCARDILVLH